MNRFVPLLILAGGLSGIAVLLGIAEAFEASWARYAAFAVIPVSGLAVVGWRKQREKSTRSADGESIETTRDIYSRASVLRDVLVVTPLLLLAAVWFQATPGWVWLALLMGVIVGDYWVRAARAE